MRFVSSFYGYYRAELRHKRRAEIILREIAPPDLYRVKMQNVLCRYRSFLNYLNLLKVLKKFTWRALKAHILHTRNS